MKGCFISRTYDYLKDPRPDLLPAFKLMLSPEFKIPLKDFIRYFAVAFASKAPGLQKLTGGERKVDFTEYMLAYDRTTASFAPYRQMLSRIVEILDLKAGEKVVDLGSGTGNLSLRIGAKQAQAISVDCSAEANRIHLAKNARAEILPIDIDRKDKGNDFIPLKDQSVDRVCAANLWTYIKDRPTLYAEIKRILKPEGFLVLAVEKRGYSPLQILKGHLSKEYARYLAQGWLPLTAMTKVYTDFISKYDDLMITAQETKKLMRGIAAGEYAVFTAPEIVQELQRNGFRVVSAETTYADQAIIVKAFPES